MQRCINILIEQEIHFVCESYRSPEHRVSWFGSRMELKTRREFVIKPKKKLYSNKKLKRKFKSNSLATKMKHTSSYKSKLPPSIKNRGLAKLKQQHFTYPFPIILTLICLMLIILVVPSIIVLTLGTNAAGTNKAKEETALTDTESISVAVMRTKADVVEDVPLENYIVGVVAAEMHADFELEALKAQALAARTYTVSHLMGNNQEETYDITDTVQHQVYKNDKELRKQWGSSYDENMQKIKNAVHATEGEILTYNEEPIMPAFFSMSNGYTENSEDYWENELPYLRSVESPWELDNPKLTDQKTFSITDLEELLEINIGDKKSTDIVISRKESKRVEQLTIEDNRFTGREIRDKLELRSSDFSVTQKDDHYIFTTKGYGHGVGMSQYGADGMAKEGKTYKDIVKYYYQGIEISNIDETVPTLVSK